jgi:hypothetical protein
MLKLARVLLLLGFLVSGGFSWFYYSSYRLASPAACLQSSYLDCTPSTYTRPLTIWLSIFIATVVGVIVTFSPLWPRLLKTPQKSKKRAKRKSLTP